MKSLSVVMEYYATYLEPRFGAPRGASRHKIAKIEAELGAALPALYVEYLAWMGEDRDGVFRGSDWFADDVVANTKYVPELLAENGICWDPATKIVCFFVHQGYMAAWFALPALDDDPPCFFFSEADADATKPRAITCFSEFLLDELKSVPR